MRLVTPKSRGGKINECWLEDDLGKNAHPAILWTKHTEKIVERIQATKT